MILNPPIVICTVENPGVSVLQASLAVYAPQHSVFLWRVKRTTFGESYNAAMEDAFKWHDEIIISNDDVVLKPNTMKLLMEDVRQLQQEHGDKLGFVATLTDEARAEQNIRVAKEGVVRQERVIAPLFAWVSKKTFETARFPPLNWYSDDVMCEDLNALGFKHFVSRAYVHHAGSQTIGTNYSQLNAEALPWLMEKRPQYIKKWFGGTV